MFFPIINAVYTLLGQAGGSGGKDLDASLDSHDASRWQKADGWTNGDPFNNGWRADHAVFENGMLTLQLDDQGCPSRCSSKPYASGEYRTNTYYGYGTLEARLKPAKGDGTVSSLFFYTGPSEGNPHDEIDIEFLGKDTTRMQVNYFTNGVQHPFMIDLGFDAAEDFHTYKIQWEKDSITWYVDGNLVHTEDGSRGPLPTHPGKIMANLWPGIGVDGWLNPFTYRGPLQAQYDWIKFTPSAEAAPAAEPTGEALTIPAPPPQAKEIPPLDSLPRSEKVLPYGQPDREIGKFAEEDHPETDHPKLDHLQTEKHLELDQLYRVLIVIAAAPENKVIDSADYQYSQKAFEELYPELKQIEEIDAHYDHKVYWYLFDSQQFWNNAIILLSVFTLKAIKENREDMLAVALDIALKFKNRIAAQKKWDQITRKEFSPTDYSRAALEITIAEIISQTKDRDEGFYKNGLTLCARAMETLNFKLPKKELYPSRPDDFLTVKGVTILADLHQQLYLLTGREEHYAASESLYDRATAVEKGLTVDLTSYLAGRKTRRITITDKKIEENFAFNLERGYISRTDKERAKIGLYEFLPGTSLIKRAAVFAARPRAKSIDEILQQYQAVDQGVALVRSSAEKMGVNVEQNRYFFDLANEIQGELLLLLADKIYRDEGGPKETSDALIEEAEKRFELIPQKYDYLSARATIKLIQIKVNRLAYALKKGEATLADAENLLQSLINRLNNEPYLAEYGEYWDNFIVVLSLFTQTAIEESNQEKLARAFTLAKGLKDRFARLSATVTGLKLRKMLPSEYGQATLDLTLGEIYAQTENKTVEFYQEGMQYAYGGVNHMLSLPDQEIRPSAPDYFSVAKGISTVGDLYQRLGNLTYKNEYYQSAALCYNRLTALREGESGLQIDLEVENLGRLHVSASPQEIEAALDENIERGYLFARDKEDALAGIYHYAKGTAQIKLAGLFVAWPRVKTIAEVRSHLAAIGEGLQEIEYSAEVVGVAPEKNRFYSELGELLQAELLLALADRINLTLPRRYTFGMFDRQTLVDKLTAAADQKYAHISGEFKYLYAWAQVKRVEIVIRTASYVRQIGGTMFADAKYAIQDCQKRVDPLVKEIEVGKEHLPPEYLRTEFDYLQAIFYLSGYPNLDQKGKILNTEVNVFPEVVLRLVGEIEADLEKLPAEAQPQKVYFSTYAKLKKAGALYHQKKPNEALAILKEVEREVGHPLSPYIRYKQENWSKLLLEVHEEDQKKYRVKTFEELLAKDPRAAARVLEKNQEDLLSVKDNVIKAIRVVFYENAQLALRETPLSSIFNIQRVDNLIKDLVDKTRKVKVEEGRLVGLGELNTTVKDLSAALFALDRSENFKQEYQELLAWDLHTLRAELYNFLALVYADRKTDVNHQGTLLYEYAQSAYLESHLSGSPYDYKYRSIFLSQRLSGTAEDKKVTMQYE